MTQFFMMLISGLVIGAIYGLIALGYSLIYKASGMMSFAQGDIMTLGAYLGLTFYSILGLPFAVSLILTVVCAFFLGIALEKGVIRKLLSKNVMAIYVVLATIAISYIIQNGIELGWGTVTIYFPSIFQRSTIKLAGIFVQPEAILCCVAAFVCMFLLRVFMSRSRLGIAMRASAMDGMAAESLGIDVSLSTGISWGLSAGLASVAGMLIGPIYGLYSTLGATIGRKGFAGAVVGGFGNMYGAMIGGLLLGVTETFAAGYISSNYKNLIAYILLLVFLLIKPTGLFNERAIQDV